jgi:hypothetical protein
MGARSVLRALQQVLVSKFRSAKRPQTADLATDCRAKMTVVRPRMLPRQCPAAYRERPVKESSHVNYLPSRSRHP